MTAEQLVAIASAALSLFFAYIPGVQGWYDALETVPKRLVMGVLLLALTVGTFALSCAGIIVDMVACDRVGAVEFTKLFFLALGINQGAHWVRPKKK